jgi:hypothetical protein
MVEYDRTLVVRQMVDLPTHPYVEMMKKFQERDRVRRSVFSDDGSFGIWIGGRVPASPPVDERLLKIDPDEPIRLEVKLPTCGKAEGRYQLVTQMVGGHEVNLDGERFWGLHVRADNYSYCSEMEYVRGRDGVWSCPECGAVR